MKNLDLNYLEELKKKKNKNNLIIILEEQDGEIIMLNRITNKIQDGEIIMLLNQITNKIQDGETTIMLNQITTNKIQDGDKAILKIIISLMELLQMIIKDGEQILLIMTINNNLNGEEELNRHNNHNKILGEALLKINQHKVLLKILGEVIKIHLQ